MADSSYPGVYVEESGTNVHPIAGVDTSTAGMVGVTDRGPIEAQLVTSWNDFADRFGDSTTPPAIFRRVAVRISLLLAAEATRGVPAVAGSVQTPLGPADATRVSGEVVVVPQQPCVRCTMVTRPQPALERDLDIFRTVARHHAGTFGVWTAVRTPGTVRTGDRLELVAVPA